MKTWNIKTADREFSNFARNRDRQVCQRCNSRTALTCSHYFSRRVMSLRFEPDNSVTLCLHCHSFWEENKKTNGYKFFMEFRLGALRFAELEQIYHGPIMKEREAIEKCREFLVGVKHG